MRRAYLYQEMKLDVKTFRKIMYILNVILLYFFDKILLNNILYYIFSYTINFSLKYYP